jgi:hypothetical protein
MTGPLRLLSRYANGGFAAREKMKDEPYYDPALAYRISKVLGPGFQSAFSPSKKRFLKTDFPLNLRGMYTLPDSEQSPFVYPYSTGRDGQKLHDILTPTPDTVYNFGPTPSAKTIAHEYRHRAGVRNERKNRLYDGLYADTPEDWKQAVEMWRDETSAASDEEAERDLLTALRRSEARLRSEEWTLAPEGQKPAHSDPTILGWLTQMILGDRAAYSLRGPSAYEKFEKKARGGLASLRAR